MTLVRSETAQVLQLFFLANAALAAFTARSISAVFASGTWPINASVLGLMISITFLEFGLTHSPPMKKLSRRYVSKYKFLISSLPIYFAL